jgi:hypothetical protein
MRHSNWKHLIWFLPLVFLISFLLSLSPDQAEEEYWSPKGGHDPRFSVIGLLALPMAAAFFSIPVALVLLCFRKTRWISLFLILGTLVFCGSMFLSLEHRLEHYHSYDDSPCKKALTQLNERFTPVIQGIEQFQKDKGQYPKNLQDLIPTYLKEIPSTNLGSFPQCRYLTGEEAKQCGENPWVLVMDDPKSAFANRILYYPLQNYPPVSHDEFVSQTGKWAYIRNRD